MILPSATVIQTLGLVGHMSFVAFAVMKGALENLKEKRYEIYARFRAEVLSWTLFRTPLVNLVRYRFMKRVLYGFTMRLLIIFG